MENRRGFEGNIPRKSTRNVRSGEEMMEVLADDVLRYELLTEQEEERLIESLRGEAMEFAIDVDNTDHPPQPHDENLAPEAPYTPETKGRFKKVTTEECDKFLIDNQNRNTKYKTKSDLKIFQDWAKENGEMRSLEEISAEELDGLLARMYLGLCKKDGSEYEPDTLTSIQNSIDRHLRDLKISFNIKKDAIFSHSRRVLESKRKSLKQMGKGNKSHKADALATEDISILHEKKVLGPGNPQSLLNSVWMNNGVYFGLRGRQDHVNLLWGDIQLKSTSDHKEYLEFNERGTKTRSGAKQGDYRRVAPKMFEKRDDLLCPVKLYKEYRDHRPEDMNTPDARFYLRPLNDPSANIWYSRQPIGKDKLGKMMNLMADQGGLTGRKVNHSTRKTFATTLVHAGLPPTEVAHLGGWKNIQTINEYSAPSVKQQEEASNLLSNVLVPCHQSNHVQEVERPPTDQNYHCRSQTQTVTCNKQSAENPLSFFSGASISGGNITINIMSSKKRKLEVSSCSASSSENSQ